jgi:hypothetical protein
MGRRPVVDRGASGNATLVLYGSGESSETPVGPPWSLGKVRGALRASLPPRLARSGCARLLLSGNAHN